MRSSFVMMDDPAMPALAPATDLPGEPLESGFRLRRSRDVPEATLSDAARERVFKKMQSVDEARLRAAKDGHTSYVG